MSTLKVGAIRGVSASSDAISVANDGTCTANITNNLSNRNKVINGAMVINQRLGTYNRPSGDEYTVDRFKTGSGSSFNFDTLTTQDSSAPDGFSKSLKITPQSSRTPTGSENGFFVHYVEGQNLQDLAYGTSSARKITFSFYAKSSSQNNNHVYSIQLRKIQTGGAVKHVLQPFTVTSSYQRFSFTFDGDTASDIIDGNVTGLEINFMLAAGSSDLESATSTWTTNTGFRGVTGQSNFMDNTSNEFFLTGVQLEVGSVATDFEHRSPAQELLLCQRYYQEVGRSTTMAGNTGSTQIGNVGVPIACAMRATPTIASGITYHCWHGNSGGVNNNGTAMVINTFNTSSYPQHSPMMSGTVSGFSLTDNRTATVVANAGILIKMSAEL